MVRGNIDKNQTKLIIGRNDYNVPLDHFARFFVEFMEESCEELGFGVVDEKEGRPSFNDCSMLKLITYSEVDHVTSARKIADMARYHDVYKYVCDGITPSERTIQRYREKYGEEYKRLLQMTLKKARDAGLTEFNHVIVDGTIKKGHNSNYNTITRKEMRILLNYYKGMPVSNKILNKLNKPAKKFLHNKNMTDSEKLEKLYDIETQFTLTGQNKIPMHDIEARMMKGKKGNFQISYNVQSAVDYDSKLICAINVTQNPTDHYELPEIADKAINNIGTIPKYMSADTIYLNPTSLGYFKDKEIDGIIPTRKQSKERIGKLNTNPYHKDHFEYDGQKDAFRCPEGEYLYFYKEYTIQEEEKPNKIKRLYNNYKACKNCKNKNKCITPKQTHKTITENGDRLQIEMYLKMEKEQYKKEYTKRSAVEGPFGTLKEHYHIENKIVIGKTKTEERINLTALAYNIKRIYNMMYDKKNKKEDIMDFCEDIVATHQLKLDVNIL